MGKLRVQSVANEVKTMYLGEGKESNKHQWCSAVNLEPVGPPKLGTYLSTDVREIARSVKMSSDANNIG